MTSPWETHPGSSVSIARTAPLPHSRAWLHRISESPGYQRPELAGLVLGQGPGRPVQLPAMVKTGVLPRCRHPRSP